MFVPNLIENIQKRKEVSKNNKQSSQDKSFNIPEDGGKEGQSKIEKELGVNNEKTSKDNLTSNILVEVNKDQKEKRKQNILNSRASLSISGPVPWAWQ